MHLKQLIVGLVVAAALGLSFLFFAPEQIGGSTVYTATSGVSMEPLFHKGDLALIRPAPSYHVGQIVLYESPTLHRPVLHRIKVIQNGRYYFKGDNNDFVDPGYATRSELVGSLWFRVPHGGTAINWVGKPSHASLLAGFSVVFLLLGGGTATRRRKRASVIVAPPERQRPKSSWLRRGWHRPRKSPAVISSLVALFAGALLLALGLNAPVKRTVEIPGVYSNTGTFSYTGKAGGASEAYPKGVAETGDPIFLNRVKRISIGFRYALTTGAAHQVHGTIALRAFVSSDSSWHQLSTLVASQPFVGDTASVHGTFDLIALQKLITQLAIDSGSVGGAFDVELRPVVHVTGIVAGKHIDDVFAPVLDATATQAELKVTPALAATPPGASYSLASPTDSLAAAFHQSAVGTVPGITANFVTLARYHVPVGTARGLGLGLAVIGLLAFLSEQFRKRRDIWESDRRIAFRHGRVLIDVLDLGAPDGAAAVEVADLENLAALAEQCDLPILRRRSSDGTVYAVEGRDRFYLYRAPEALALPAPLDEPLPAVLRIPAPGRRTPARRALRPAGVLLVLVVVIGVGTSFTAANVVPASNIGTSLQPRQIAQLAPSQCAGMSLTNLIVATTSSVNGTAGNDLIIGRTFAGTLNVNAGAGDDCVVLGGDATTTNTVDGGAGNDVCIAGPSAKKNTLNHCEA